MKSLAHPDWPYTGTPWEWRGFGDAQKHAEDDDVRMIKQFNALVAIYQKQNLGPELP